MKGYPLLAIVLLTVMNVTQEVDGAAIQEPFIDSVVNGLITNTSIAAIQLNVTQMITEYGYHCEEHYVQTEDGYCLFLSRIPSEGPPMLVMPGLLNSADEFFTLGPQNALGCLLADAGYDVWIGNPRGTKYSRKHILLPTNERQYWNFSFNEIGVYDLPAMIDFVLDKSNYTQLTYIGHSQGTTVFYVMASERPEYNCKVSLMVSMATVAWLYRAKTPVFTALVPFRNLIDAIASTLHIYDVLPYDALSKFITGRLCTSSKFAMNICATVLFSVYGFDYPQLNYTQFPTQIGHVPAGASVKQLLHFAQLITSKKFQKYDYNTKEDNMKMYNSESPPAYPVENISTPVAILYADNDWISSFQDVQILISKLPNCIDIYRVPYPLFNHMDYLWAKDAKRLLYTKVLQLVKESTMMSNCSTWTNVN